MEHLSALIVKLTGDDLPIFCKYYQWICKTLLKEEIHIRRNNGEYRLSTFKGANEEVYSVSKIMTPYMNGLLMTQLWWPNHTASISFLKDRFLPSMPGGYDHIEMGPGHGLLFSYPVAGSRSNHLEAWDLSQASLDATRLSLNNMGFEREVTLRYQDVYEIDETTPKFDGVIFSEVLEHLEEPAAALVKLKSILKRGGKLYIHIPINSPAPDYIFNLLSPEAVVDFIEKSGLKVTDSEFAPMMGQSLEECIKYQMTISCLLTCEAA
mgnify:CR=1 FL=1